jgi:transcriptional regulator with XRE-family HTH domain
MTVKPANAFYGDHVARIEQGTPLARRMHALKVRTNRSYAALANRIGVSGSTLHRYCRGETVPPHIEVVARFAAVCGASGDESEELLRCWVLTMHPRSAELGPLGRLLRVFRHRATGPRRRRRRSPAGRRG